MPVYDFKCADCGMLTEVLLRGEGGQGVRCPECGSEKMDKLVSAPSMIRTGRQEPGTTCCGRIERCETSPCSEGGTCRRA